MGLLLCYKTWITLQSVVHGLNQAASPVQRGGRRPFRGAAQAEWHVWVGWYLFYPLGSAKTSFMLIMVHPETQSRAAENPYPIGVFVQTAFYEARSERYRTDRPVPSCLSMTLLSAAQVN